MGVSFGPAALRDLRSILAHLAHESPRAASEFSAAIIDLWERLSEFPDAGAPAGTRGHRFVMISGFPYKVFYRPIGQSELRVVRIRHARRRPLRFS
ncbi:type II toxin-antitoxin system RelE/ParE family toxin [Enterovirga aerilata]|uniref:Type II toxin-antitoxin system RelE/ParE family toxin n=1 Tax=Enterovirga aerilata TaxID=2730920 RepID=A0A849I646_9HYPH|nr:type II toxin-antitoxin system RelE/ParE family toxin [Enterovirga sp. DB1703]